MLENVKNIRFPAYILTSKFFDFGKFKVIACRSRFLFISETRTNIIFRVVIGVNFALIFRH